MKIDVSKFKKIEMDEKSTTLQHPSGHLIKIAHKNLSSEYKKELDALPVHKAAGGFLMQKSESHPRNSKPSQPSKPLPEAAYTPPKEAKHAYTEPDNMGTRIPPNILRQEIKSNSMPDVVLKALHREAPPLGPLGAEAKYHAPPCINPSCKSYGQSHPNCRCYGGKMGMYGGYAEGGEVEHFCSQNRSHEKGCEYFAEGGEVKPEENKYEKYWREMMGNKSPEQVAKERAQMPPTEPQKILTLAEGGRTDSEKLEDAAREADLGSRPIESVAESMPEPQATPAPQAQAMPVTTPAPQEVNASPEIPETHAVASAPEPMQQQQQAQAAATPIQKFQQHKDQHVQDIFPEAQAFKADLDNGHIKPETYHDLFAKKDTLGKIGTIFGLLLGGMGSGLAHQPNTLLEMMNKQIDNDLHAQEQSVQNKQNFLKINQANVLNKAQSENLTADAKIKANALAKVQMNYAALHKLVSDTQKLPEGPQKQQALQTLAMINQGVQNENFNILDRAASGAAFYSTLFGNQQGGEEQQFQKGIMARKALGPQGEKIAEDLESKHLPGIKGQASMPLSGGDREQIESGVEFDKQLQNYMDWARKHPGDLNPKDVAYGRSLAAGVQGAYRLATHGGVYKEGEQNFISKIIDDDPTKFFNEIRVLPKVQAVADQHKVRMNTLLKSKGFSGYSGSQSQPSNALEGKTATNPQGHKIIMKNGKWQPYNG